MPRSVKSSSRMNYSKLWKGLTENAIFPAVHNKLYKTKGRKKKQGGSLKVLHSDWFTPVCKLRIKKKSLKQRGGYIRGGSRVFRISQEQCTSHQSVQSSPQTQHSLKHISVKHDIHKNPIMNAKTHTMKQNIS